MTLDCDILIAGAGMSGLAAALEIRERAPRLRVRILDARETPATDRTFSFFEVGPHRYQHLVTKRYTRIEVRTGEHRHLRRSDAHPYAVLPAARAHEHAIGALGSHGIRIDWSTRVEQLVEHRTHVAVHTSQGEVRTQLVLDARGGGIEGRRGARDIDWVQHFMGAFVRTEHPIFDPSTATLMDFRVDQPDGIHFVYVLPTSPSEALVEDTYFSLPPTQPPRYAETLEAWLNDRCAGRVEVLSTEAGELPMSTCSPLDTMGRIHIIGQRGGVGKPSSGYAFWFAQAHAARIAARLRDSVDLRLQLPRPRGHATMLLDRIFLAHLAAEGPRGYQTFERLFARAEPARVARFLSERGSLRDHLEVIASVPKLRVALAAVRNPALTLGRLGR